MERRVWKLCKKMKVLVTGGTGFIGSHLVDRLVEANHNVLVPVRKESNIKWLPSRGVDVKEVDLLDLEAVKGLLKGIDVVFHLASIRGMGWSFENKEVHRVNVGITENLLKVHPAQVLTYLRLSQRKLGLVLNFGQSLLRDGIYRVVNNF